MRVLFSQGLIAISKPRCGSTSVRRILDKLVDVEKGDIAVDVAGQREPYHPHHTAPFLKQLLRKEGYMIDDMTTFIFTRHPVDMLWSYFNYFKPDKSSRYSYSSNWQGNELMEFEDWIMRGRVGMHLDALPLAPEWVNMKDLTPLSLEAHIDTKDGHREVDFIFKVEEIDKFIAWLGDRTSMRLSAPHINRSGAGELPEISESSLTRIRRMFPMECEMYSV